MEYHSTCETLTLKLFYKVIESGDLSHLKLDADNTIEEEVLEAAWQQIMAQYAKLDKNVSVDEILDINKEVWRLVCEQAEVKGMLLYLVGAESKEYEERLKELGYPIDLSSLENKKKSLVKCDRKANHTKTKVLLLKKRIEQYKETDTTQAGSFDSTMGWLAIHLGFEPSEDLTVSRYLSYKAQIIQRQKAKQSKKKPEMA